MPPKKAEKKAPAKVDDSGISKNDVTFTFNLEIKHNNVADTIVMFEWIDPLDSAKLTRIDTELIENWQASDPEAPDVVTFTRSFEEIRVDDDFVKQLARAQKFFVYFVSTDDQKFKREITFNYSSLLMDRDAPRFEHLTGNVGVPGVEYFKLTLTADKELLTPHFKDYLNPLQFTIVGAKELPVEEYSHACQPVYVKAKFWDGSEIRTHELPHSNTCKWHYKQVILAGLMDSVKLKEQLSTVPMKFEVHDQDVIAKNNILEQRKLLDIPPDEEEKQPEEPVKGKGKKDAKGKPPAKEKEKEKEKDKGKKDAKKKKDVKAFEPIKEVDEKQIIDSNHGLANFMLTDLLKQSVRTVKLRSFIIPIQKYVNNDFQNLQLNTTARKETASARMASSYLTKESYLVVGIDIARALGPYKPPEPSPEEEQRQQEVPKPDTKKKPAGKAAADDKKSKQSPAKNKPPSHETKGKPTQVTEESASPQKNEELKPIYERAVYLFPYKSQDLVQRLQYAVAQINLEALGGKEGNMLLLTTKSLTPEEKSDRTLDIITGFTFIDKEYRTFVLEGLGEKGMRRLAELFPREEPNSETTKILKNPDILFKERLYADYNCDIRRIKLRENLSKLLFHPDIYLRSKVPQHIYDTLVILNETRRCWSMKEIVASNLFADKTRKYGDALTDEDITGIEAPPKKPKKKGFRRIKDASQLDSSAASVSLMDRSVGKMTVTQTANQTATTISLNKSTSSDPKTLRSTVADKTGGIQDAQIHIQYGSSDNEQESKSTQMKRLRSLQATRKNEDTYNIHMKHLYPIDEGQDVHHSANQKLNIYERQKEELREIVRNDPNHFYTYSLEYMSQSIDPFTMDEAKARDNMLSKSKFVNPTGFQTVAKKDKSQYNAHPKKPHPSTIADMKTETFDDYKTRVAKEKRNIRGQPLPDINKDFNTRVKSIAVFSNPEVVEEEKLTAVEQDRRLKESKMRATQDWKDKLVVDNPTFAVSTATHASQLDKYKGMRQGPAIKHGFQLKNSKMKDSNIQLDKELKDLPVSMYLEEAHTLTPAEKLFERNFDPERSVVNKDFTKVMKAETKSSQLYKPMKNLF